MTTTPQKPSRRAFLRGALRTAAGAVALTAAPHVFIPRRAYAQSAGRGSARHLIYIRLRGGFRFTTAFNGDVAPEYNPFGLAEGRAPNAEWGASALLARAPWLTGDDGARRAELGMRPVHELADRLAVIPCVDHEPLAAGADGNHGSGLERYWTGSVGGPVSFFTMINYGLRDRLLTPGDAGEIRLPAFCLGDAGMARGLGAYAAHRPPVAQSGGFDRFALTTDRVPAWARALSRDRDVAYRDRLVGASRDAVDGYLETRLATERFTAIFQSDALRIQSGADPIDGVSNDTLRLVFGDDDAGRNARLALRLFHFGCPAVYLDQGGYDLHSGEEQSLPGRMEALNRLISGLVWALHALEHPAGGTYWDHTIVAIGSEFGRTARGNRFNSARGSDHNSDRATRWMSMPFFGGPIAAAGRQLGRTRPADLVADGPVYGYRAVLKTLLDALGADHSPFFAADQPFDDLFV